MDLKAAARDGWEIAWPIRYADLKPYYDQVDQLIGVCGGDDDSEVLPGSKFHQPPPARAAASGCIAAGGGQARHPDGDRPPREHDEAHARLPAVPLLRQVRRRLRHGVLLQLRRPPAAVRAQDRQARAALERGGRARARGDDGPGQRRAVLRPAHRAEQRVYGKVVVVGASCVDSTRILLNSKSDRHPNGLGNGSDVIGRYLCEQIRIHARGFLPAALRHASRQRPRHRRRAHVHAALQPPRGHKRDYLRGFGMQFWNTGSNPDGAGHYAAALPGFGAGFKHEVKRRYPAWVELHPFGEVLPYAHNRITVDEKKTDRYGVPLRTSTTASATTSGRWPSTWPTRSRRW